MSRDYHNICGRVLELNKDLYANPDTLLKEIESLKKEMKKMSLVIEQIHRLVLEIKQSNDY